MESASGSARGLRATQAEAGTHASPPGADPHTDLSPPLRDAFDSIVGQWADRDDAGLLMEADIRPALLTLARAIERAATESVPFDVGATPNPVMLRRLLVLLEAELVRSWKEAAEPPGASEMLRYLGAVVDARAVLDPDWGQDVGALLTSPNGLELVAEVAHDLRSPLSAILFLSDVLRRGQSGELTEVQYRQVGLIYSATISIIEIASDLIELARGGDRLAEREPFSVAETLNSVRSMLQPMAEEKALDLSVTMSGPDHRYGYPVALGRVLLNLATNALKFTDHGSVSLIARSLSDDELRCEVVDTGPGISEKGLRALYQPLRSRKDAGYYFSGSGLGLSIARRLVEAMDSTLQMETRVGHGTRFFFDVKAPPAAHL